MIIFFSGTGNSSHVAKELARLLGETTLVQLKGELLYDPLKSRLSTDDRRIIWVFPTYSWGVPPVVGRFIREAEIIGAEHARHYMVVTCGDDIGETAKMWRRMVSARKWTPTTAYSVMMPNTYVCMKGFDVDSKDIERKKLEEAPARIAEIASRINGGIEGDSLLKGSWPGIKTGIIYRYFTKFCMSPKPFKSNGRCIGCGKCAKACPMDNITMDNDRPVWHDRCALCLRCYHICPGDAIEYGKATKDKGQYILE